MYMMYCVMTHRMPCREETGGFDTRPPPWEVRERVDRRRDRAIKLDADKAAARSADK
jgi:hypothetical protein